MLSEQKREALIDREQRPVTPELQLYQEQLLRALAQGTPWPGGRIPISFLPSPYRVRVNESRFFASTALDCLRLPAVLGETITVESICPSNGTAIQLTITDLGVTSHDPPGCVMTLAAPGTTLAAPETTLAAPETTLAAPETTLAAKTAGDLDDPHGLSRQLNRFFSSAEAAALWLVAYPGVTILDIERAWRLVDDIAPVLAGASLFTAGDFIE